MLFVLAISFAACSKDNPFEGETEITGKLMTRLMKVELNNEENLVRAAVVPAVDDFSVAFYKEGSATPVATYVYSELPEIITLPVGKYTARAFYGDNAPAAWDAPYYKGEVSFEIFADKVTDNVGPIVCRLASVKVTVLFDDELTANMDAGSKVTINVGDEGSLEFTKADEERSGYFAYVEESHTMAAIFTGTVEGFQTREIKTYDNVEPGNHYRITFRLRTTGSSDPGDIDGSLLVDASVEIIDINESIDPEEEVVVDDMRPKEEDEGGKPGPGPVDPGADAPEIICVDKDNKPYEEGEGIKLDEVNKHEEGTLYRLLVTSSADGGITAFTVDIESPAPALSDDELKGMGLAAHLDLVNAEAKGLKDGLEALSLPYGDAVYRQPSVTFDISGFMDLLAAVGSGMTHTFVLTVTDANGTVSRKLMIEIP